MKKVMQEHLHNCPPLSLFCSCKNIIFTDTYSTWIYFNLEFATENWTIIPNRYFKHIKTKIWTKPRKPNNQKPPQSQRATRIGSKENPKKKPTNIVRKHRKTSNSIPMNNKTEQIYKKSGKVSLQWINRWTRISEKNLCSRNSETRVFEFSKFLGFMQFLFLNL